MKQFMKLLLLLAVLLAPLGAMAKSYSVELEKASAEKAIAALKKETGLEFVYNKDLLKQAKTPVTCTFRDVTLDQLLNRVVSINMGLAYEVMDRTVFLKKPQVDVELVRGEINGTVIDADLNEPLPGATVFIEGTHLYAVTDADGKFAFKDINAVNPTLSVIYVGMKPVSLRVVPGNQKNLQIDLHPQATMISEVVVTGYGDIKKEKMTGSATTISSDKLEDRYTTNLLDNLEGRVAGLSTYGGKAVIRGIGTLNGNSNPLLVVDGLPVEGSLSDLNTYDIESVNVLKDAAASAIYGARAANGIIVVTTKNAKKKGKIDIDFSANVTWYEKKNMDYHDNFYMTPDEQIDAESKYYEWYYFENDPLHNNDPARNIMATATNFLTAIQEMTPLNIAYYQLATGEIDRAKLNQLIDGYRGNNYARDYADAIYRRQVMQQYNVSLRSSSDISRNNVVVNYKYDNSGIINHKADWLNVYYKGTFDIAKWLTANVSINSIFANTREAGYDYNSYASNPWYFTPYTNFYNPDGSVATHHPWFTGNPYMDPLPGLADLGVNPVDEMYNNTQSTRRQNMRYHGDLLFKIIKGLTANAQFIYETSTQTSQQHATEASHAARTIKNAFATVQGDKVVYMTPETGGFLATQTRNGNYWTARGQVNYTNTFGKNDIQAIAGLEFRQTLDKGNKTISLGYDEQLQSSASHTVDFGAISTLRYSPYFMTNGAQGFPCGQFAFDPYIRNNLGLIKEVKHRYGSGYANATYTYDDRYNIFGSFRKDYADVYGLNSKYRGKPLWSVGAGWNLHNENFMHPYATWFNFFKLRASYGVTGNIFQGATSVMTASTGQTNQTTNAPFGMVVSPDNPELRWEQNRTTNVGIDFSFLNYRLGGSIDYYYKDGRDIFHTLNLDPTTGFTAINANAASIANQGVEIALNYNWFEALKRSDFAWTTSATFTYNKNKVKKVENDAETAGQLINTPFKVGYPVYALWTYRYAGISDVLGMEGQTLFYGNGDQTSHNVSGQSPDILEFSGQADPKYIFSMDNNFRWNGLTFSFVLAYYGGHKMVAQPYNEIFADFASPLASYFNNAWTPENPTDVPGIGKYASNALGRETAMCNRSVHDASFLKIRNIVLSYELPQKWVRAAGMNLVSLRFQANNLPALWKANKIGIDPETNGIRLPVSYTVGLNINL